MTKLQNGLTKRIEAEPAASDDVELHGRLQSRGRLTKGKPYDFHTLEGPLAF